MEWVPFCTDTRGGQISDDILTPWGRYRYKTAPQGYKVSGDAYTARYDRITEGVKKMRRVIDDTLLYEDDVEKSFRQVAEYLSLVGSNGMKYKDFVMEG